MIEADGLVKRYGSTTAVAGINFQARPGRVTGFLGPNGAGKSTTIRMIVGLDRPTTGFVTVGGRSYREQEAPLREVGALLEARAAHRGRTARNHLRILAATHGIPRSRVQEVIGLAGLETVAERRVGGFSLGMSQRLGIAAALLGDPATLILDEPINGLDPEGVLWVRGLVRGFADEGRTVFLSSHLMSETAQVADDVIVLGRGRILAAMPIEQLLAGNEPRVIVDSPRASELADLIGKKKTATTSARDRRLEITGMEATTVGDIAAAAGIALHQLTTVNSSLEDAYMTITNSDVEYRSAPSASRASR